MIYFFYGSDEHKVRVKAFDWVAAARKKEPNLVYKRLAREDLTSAVLEDAAAAGGLFVSRLLILIDDPFPPARAASDEEEASEDVVRPASDVGRTTSHTSDVIDMYLDQLAASDNAIVILAPRLPAAKAKKIAAKAKIEYKFDLPAQAGAPTARDYTRGFNTGLVNALATRSREKLWLEIVRALYAGDSPEMLHGLLHWKARDIMEKGSRSWQMDEARKLSIDLITLVQETRRKGLDLSHSLERFALSI